MRLKGILCLLGLLISTVVFIAGCGNDVHTLTDKRSLTVGVTNFADTLEPTQNYFAWAVVRYGIGETLTRFNDKMQAEPWLAESWAVSSDHLTWTFVINKKACFSNGRPVTAEAVKASIERVFKKNKRAVTFFTYTKMTAQGQVLQITTTKPVFDLPGILADPLFLIVDVEAEKEGRNFAVEGPIATGPYKVEHFTKEEAELVKNIKYWNGQVPFNRITVTSIDDPTTRAMALKSGDIQVAVNVGPNDIDQFRDRADFAVSEVPSIRTVFILMNENTLLKDERVRAAIISACNRKAYADILLRKDFVAGKAPLPPSLPYDFNSLQDPNSYNPVCANQLLEEAGWHREGKGIRQKDNKPLQLTLTIYTIRPELPIYAEAVQADLRTVGIDLKIKTVDYNLINKISKSGTYDMLMLNTTTAPTGDPRSYLKHYWQSKQTGNLRNASGYANVVVDNHLQVLQNTFDKEKQKLLVQEIEQTLLNTSASVFLGYPSLNMVSSTVVTGLKAMPSDYYWITTDIRPAE